MPAPPCAEQAAVAPAVGQCHPCFGAPSCHAAGLLDTGPAGETDLQDARHHAACCARPLDASPARAHRLGQTSKRLRCTSERQEHQHSRVWNAHVRLDLRSPTADANRASASVFQLHGQELPGSSRDIAWQTAQTCACCNHAVHAACTLRHKYPSSHHYHVCSVGRLCMA